ncbi:MAG TPA: tetratricopeptide repeat protein [Drouetiella sp.]
MPSHTDTIASLRSVIHNPREIFSASKMLKDLEAVKVEAKNDPQVLREATILIGEVEYKRGELTAALSALEEAMAMPRQSTDVTEDCQSHNLMAKINSELGRHESAAKQYKIAAELAKSAAKLTASQKLGLYEKYAFELHECRQYQEALKINTETLEKAEQLFGKDDPRLTTIITNTAQNLYMLKRFAEAKKFLERCLAISTKSGNIEKQQDMLFQLGVLACEEGDAKDARLYMQQRVALLSKHGNQHMLDVAKSDLAELENRLKK